MRTNKILAAAATASLLAVAACGGAGEGDGNGGGNGGGDSGNSANAEPAWGVPPATDPLPMPQQGKRYDNPQPRENIKDGGTLKLPLSELGPNFNAFSVDGNSVYVDQVWQWIAPQLWNISPAGEPSPNPDYLESVELVDKDPETVKYVINSEATWNNGDPITWKAFETTWKTQNGKTDKYNPAATTGYDSIGSVEQGDNPKVAVVTFAKPFYPYQLVFGNLEHPKNEDPKFYKKGWVNDLNPDLMAGPYTVSSLSKKKLVLEPNPKWWGKEPKLDKVIYTQMESKAQVNAFQNGEIAATSVRTAERMKQVSDMDDVLLKRGFRPFTGVLTLRKYDELFQDKNGRKGFVLGLNREKLANIRFQGMDWDEEPPGSSLGYPWLDTYEDNIKDLHYDADEAKQTLEQAGWTMGDGDYRHKDGETAKVNFVWFSDDPTVAAMARAVQQMEKKIGIKVKLDNRPTSEFSKTLTQTQDYDAIFFGWSGDNPFYWVGLCQIYCENSESNFSDLGNEELDELLKKPTTISDLDKAAKVGNEAESKALHLFGIFPLHNGPQQVITKKGLANISNFVRGLAGFYSAPAENVGWMTDDALQDRGND